MTTTTPDRNRTATTPDYGLGVESLRDHQGQVPRAKCRDIGPGRLFIHGAVQRKAAIICRYCPMVLQCHTNALDNRVEFGVWDGLTERQRRAMLHEHPEITSWAGFYVGQYAAQHKAKLAE